MKYLGKQAWSVAGLNVQNNTNVKYLLPSGAASIQATETQPWMSDPGIFKSRVLTDETTVALWLRAKKTAGTASSPASWTKKDLVAFPAVGGRWTSIGYNFGAGIILPCIIAGATSWVTSHLLAMHANQWILGSPALNTDYSALFLFSAMPNQVVIQGFDQVGFFLALQPSAADASAAWEFEVELHYGKEDK